MKTTLKLFGLLLITSLFFASCGKDEESEEPANTTECGDYICENGSTCVDGVCECPEGYSGNACETRLDPVSVKLTSVVVKDFPLTDAFGSAWDDDGKADLTFSITSDGLTSYFHSSIITDADPNVDHNLSVTAYSFTEPNVNYTITLLDNDGSDAPQAMSSYSFKPILTIGTGGILQLSGGSSQIDLTLKYEY